MHFLFVYFWGNVQPLSTNFARNCSSAIMPKAKSDFVQGEFDDFDQEPEILTDYYEDHYDQPASGLSLLLALFS